LIPHTRLRGLPPGILAALVATIVPVSSAEAERVPHGQPVVISGHVEPRVGGRAVVLERALLGRLYRVAKRTTSGTDGSYRFAVKAKRSAVYRAVVQPYGAASASAASVGATRRVTVVARIATRATRHVLGGGAVRVRGRLRPALRGRAIRLQLRTARGWRTVDRARTRRGGRFSAAWRASGTGRYRLRVRFRGDAAAAGTRDRLPRVHVYRGSHASWYGPGLYGNSTACGGTLTPGRLGVAHKWLPCGTKVTFRYGGRSVTVPVIDRGPYAAGREWDLTAATKARLGFPDTGVVWSTR
jgi:hypothetical protein